MQHVIDHLYEISQIIRMSTEEPLEFLPVLGVVARAYMDMGEIESYFLEVVNPDAISILLWCDSSDCVRTYVRTSY